MFSDAPVRPDFLTPHKAGEITFFRRGGKKGLSKKVKKGKGTEKSSVQKCWNFFLGGGQGEAPPKKNLILFLATLCILIVLVYFLFCKT